VSAKLPFVVLLGRGCALLADSFKDIFEANRVQVDELDLMRVYLAQQGLGKSCTNVGDWLRGLEPQLTAAGYQFGTHAGAVGGSWGSISNCCCLYS
jgi:hypothetical protein